MKRLIKNAEDRITSYKNLLEDVHKDSINFPKSDEFSIWYKQILRENKNYEQVWLKKLVDEKTYENESLNPCFCYKF